MAVNIARRLVNFWRAIPEPPVEAEPLSRERKWLLIVIIFLLAVLFRYFHYLDIAPLIANGQQDFAGITTIHDGVANDILNKGVEAIFPGENHPISDTGILQYPPGYGILLSGVYSAFGRDFAYVEIVQVLLGALAAVLLFLIALELFHRSVAIIAGLVVAISHHLAYYTLLLLPDAIVPVLIMAGTLLLIRGVKVGWGKGKGYREMALAGLFFGFSCWFRADGLLLWLFIAGAFFFIRGSLVQPVQRLLLITAMMGLVILPLTIRNYQIYHELIPVSLGSGVVLQCGLNEADPSIDLPFKDADTLRWEANFYHKPEYGHALMTPDGIFRERERTARATKIILDRPFWYLTVMADRFALMMKYSAHAPLIRTELPLDREKMLNSFQAKQGSFSGTLSYYQQKGGALDYLRPVLRLLQRVLKEGLLVLVILGAVLALKNLRSWLLLMIVPAYYLLMHITMHTEFRYVLPAHYLLFICYAISFQMIFFMLPRRIRDAFRPPAYVDAVPAQPFEQLAVPLQRGNQGGRFMDKIDHFEPNALQFEDEPIDSNISIRVDFPSARERARINIAGVNVDNLDQQETLGLIEQLIAARTPSIMVVVNASKIVLAQEDQELKQIIAQADIVTADGMSVVWASRMLGSPLKERVTGIDTFEKLVRLSARKKFSIYLLGAKSEVVEAVVNHFKNRYPTLNIAGYHDGYFGRNEDVIEDIKQTRPDILFVAMGSPRQEKWVAANLRELNVPFTIGVGGSFDHVAGFARRAPDWMQNLGLEWLHRLWQEPRRLWRRYLIGNTLFVWLVLKTKFRR